MLGIKVTFDHELEAHSDEEGIVPGRVEDSGLTRLTTSATEDCRSIVVGITDSEICREDIDQVEQMLTVGTTNGRALDTVEGVSVVDVDKVATYMSVSVARDERQ